ncbi:MAG TPA: guanylate kinase [Verrucomicrobia bacterium]|nr:guanylate kinase [Verrucomicrobiota bacterium]
MKPLLIVISAPSGAGKSTLCNRLLAIRPDITYSISCTTRAPRGGEVDGCHYFFMTPTAFEEKVAEGAFLEHAVVHGNRYGTLKQTVNEAMQQQRSVLLDIDVQGVRQVRDTLAVLPHEHRMTTGFVDIFIHPPSMEELQRRLLKRGEDTPVVIERRLENAKREIEDAGRYRYQVVNDVLETALQELLGIVEKEQAQ